MSSASERSMKMKALFGKADLLAEAAVAVPAAGDDRRRQSSGAVKSMQNAFSTIEQENELLRQRLLDSEAIIEIDPEDMKPSFIRDRLDVDRDPEFEELVSSIREHGQQLPALVRPDPEDAGRYQIAYGHRRWRACSFLQIKVKAIVRDLTDEALVVAQGKENNERKALSFIEQALFALNLKERGFERRTIAAALGRSEEQSINYISMLTRTAASFSRDLLGEIGPAPSAGRPKWERLAAVFVKGKPPSEKAPEVNSLLGSKRWIQADSDRRFRLLWDVVHNGSASGKDDVTSFQLASGKKCVVVNSTRKIMTLSVDRSQAPGLDDFLVERMPSLIAEFEATAHQQEGKQTMTE